MRRFWGEVGVRPDGTGWAVLLDGKPLRTPARHSLSVPREALAAAIAAEWAAQGQEIDPVSMPLTKLATTVVDLMPARRHDAIEEVVGFGGTDLLCYRAEHPPELVLRQARSWQPWLDWLAREHEASLVATEGVISVEQPTGALVALRRAVERLDDWRLVGLHAATTLTGSVVLGLAIERGALGAADAFAATLLDELFQIEQWGPEERQQQRHAAIGRDLDAADLFLRLLA